MNSGTPNKPSNIKWGMATPAMIDDVLDVLEDSFAVDPSALERRKEWADDDNDIFLNINFSAFAATVQATLKVIKPAAVAARTDRGKYDVVVFADDKKKAAEVAAKLQALGYTQASVNSGSPNSSANIKWGMADQATIDEILALVEREFGIAAGSIEQKHIWGADDEDVFLNLHF